MPHASGKLTSTITLAEALTKRLATLGLSRRELCRRANLSRQTLHKIENLEVTNLHPKTYALLDEFLYWKPGTALALAQGDSRLWADADLLIPDDDGALTRWRLVQRIDKMDIGELDALMAHLDGKRNQPAKG